ncbi:MAG: redoxin domain-containing protein, partial [Terriglobia bacterium]
MCLMTIIAFVPDHGKDQQRPWLNLTREAPEASPSGYPNPEPQAMTGRYGIGVALQTSPNALVIVSIRPGGPAEQAGLKKGDEIIAVDGKPVASGGGSLLTTTRGAPATLRIRRGSQESDVTVQRASMERIFNLPPQGKPAPSFALPGMNGTTVSLQEFKGRLVIVTFWATWCGPCVAESDELNKLSRKYERLVILGLDVDDKPDALQQFLQKRPMSYTVLKAGKIDGPVATSYGVTGLPLTVVIAANGLVDFVQAGGVTEDALETLVRTAMNH